MRGRYTVVRSTEESLQPVALTLQWAGALSGETFSSRAYAVCAFIFGLFNSLQLLYSATQVETAESKAILMYHGAFYMLAPLGILTARIYKTSLCFEIQDSGFTYTHESDDIKKYQKELIETFKNKYLIRYVKYVRCWLVIASSNRLIGAILRKSLEERVKYLQLYEIWYPRFINRDIFLVEMITFVHQLLSFILTSFVAMAAFMLMFVFYVHVTCEMRLLRRALSRLPERIQELMLSEKVSFETAYDQSLIECCHHQAYIQRYFQATVPMVRGMFSVGYSVGLALLSLLGFGLTSESRILKIIFIPVALALLIFYFVVYWVMEKVQDELVSSCYSFFNVLTVVARGSGE